jgi:hypothetical protein
MDRRFSQYLPLLLIPAIAVIAACDDAEPVSPTAPVAVESALITAEPVTATPEFLTGSFCPAGPPFGLRLVITVGGALDIVVRQLRFDFTDRFGGMAVPLVTPIPAAPSRSIPTSMPVPIPGSTAIPSSPVIPIPGSSPIPIPGSSPIENVRIPSGFPTTLPLFLEFGCGVPAAGTLVISVDTTDARGTSGTSRVRVRVGG